MVHGPWTILLYTHMYIYICVCYIYVNIFIYVYIYRYDKYMICTHRFVFRGVTCSLRNEIWSTTLAGVFLPSASPLACCSIRWFCKGPVPDLTIYLLTLGISLWRMLGCCDFMRAPCDIIALDAEKLLC